MFRIYAGEPQIGCAKSVSGQVLRAPLVLGRFFFAMIDHQDFHLLFSQNHGDASQRSDRFMDHCSPVRHER